MAETSPQQQVAGFIAKYDPGVARVARQARLFFTRGVELSDPHGLPRG